MEFTSAWSKLVRLSHESFLKSANFGGECFPTHAGSVQEQGVEFLSIWPYGPLVPKVPPALDANAKGIRRLKFSSNFDTKIEKISLPSTSQYPGHVPIVVGYKHITSITYNKIKCSHT